MQLLNRFLEFDTLLKNGLHNHADISFLIHMHRTIPSILDSSIHIVPSRSSIVRIERVPHNCIPYYVYIYTYIGARLSFLAGRRRGPILRGFEFFKRILRTWRTCQIPRKILAANEIANLRNTRNETRFLVDQTHREQKYTVLALPSYLSAANIRF